MTNTVVARPNGTQTMRLAATDLPDRVEADLTALEAYRQLRWGSYQCGVAHVLQQAGYRTVGCDLLYHGTVPFGAGLSSSASIEVATAVALAKLGGKTELDMVEIAVLCQKAENEYVGMNCGIMDQFRFGDGEKGACDLSGLQHAGLPVCSAGARQVYHRDHQHERAA
jgi:galactokinase